jgi:hypothetical protein
MAGTIANLLRYLAQALAILLQFLIIVILGIFVAIIYALPWVLRIGAILIWFYGGYRLVIVVGEIYAPFSPEIPVMILQFFVIIVQLGAMVGLLIVNLRLSWGALYFTGGVPLWLALKVIPAAFENWQSADLFFRVFPAVLWAMMLIYLTFKAKAQKIGKQLTQLKMPSFINLALDKVGAIYSPPPPNGSKQEETYEE